MVVSRALAARYWSDVASAIGRRVRMAPLGPWFTIVGVAGDVRGTALEEPPDETIYLPLVVAPGDAGSDARWTPRDVAFVVRDAGDPSGIAPAVERIVRTLDPSVPVYAMRAMPDVVSHAGARTSFTLLLLAIASSAALALGAVGIYGVVSYIVGLRAREIAVRLALGARPSDVRRMVSEQALIVATAGIAVGVAGAAAATRVMAALLFGVSPSDPATIAGAALLLLAVAAIASWFPAHRASRVEPARALRAE
jgi:predicted lysophospholipase L1 biosynthesis ABC-type transport system permease subunit